MKTILYLHGFNSAGTGSKAATVQQHYKGQFKVLTPTFNYKDLKNTLRVLNSLFITNKVSLVAGTSLGGFLALLSSCQHHCKCIAINPTTQPSETLRSMLGENKNYVTKERYIFQESDLAQYKALEEGDFAKIQPVDADTRFLLSQDDEVLGDHHYLEERYPTCHHFQYFEGFGHRFNSLKPLYASIEELLG